MDILNNIPRYLEVFNYIELENIIDIILITLLLYNILKPLRRTKGEQLIKGFISIFLMLKISEVLGFTALTWVIQSTLDFAVIAFIVIFQPEFRNILEKVSRRSILNKKKTNESEIRKLILTLEKSVFQLSSLKRGALIVLNRITPLDEFLENSTELDAVVTYSLLVNIFIDGSPLHDGAIIIQDNRIKAANCVLPLTTKELPVEYGTRHRAGIGLTETCDAVVIIVSEETGKITICQNGEINRFTDKIQFRQYLESLFVENKNTDNKRRI